MNYLELLEKAAKMVEAKNLDFDFMKIYPFSTENIDGYLPYFTLKDKSLLTVGSSGDQVLNSFYQGCRDITLIDINPFAKYYTNLKIAGIISLNYDEFIQFFLIKIDNIFNHNRFNQELFKKISPTLKAIDYDSYYFFSEIFCKYDLDSINNYLLNDDEEKSKIIKGINIYLQSEENYNKLKYLLHNICFTFINEDLFKFQSDNKYDNIFLSNIGGYVTLLELKELMAKLKNNNLTTDGSILIAYLWNIDFDSSEFDIEWRQIYLMAATRSFLSEFITEHFDIKGTSDISYDEDKGRDLILIYRNKSR